LALAMLTCGWRLVETIPRQSAGGRSTGAQSADEPSRGVGSGLHRRAPLAPSCRLEEMPARSAYRVRLSRLTERTGLTFNRLLQLARMDTAARLLQSSHQGVKRGFLVHGLRAFRASIASFALRDDTGRVCRGLTSELASSIRPGQPFVQRRAGNTRAPFHTSLLCYGHSALTKVMGR
jgi:hypothetical protein